MKTMKKIVAILAVALLLCSILPLSVFAADETIVFELGVNGSASHNDGSEIKADYAETVGDYTLTLTGYTKAYSGARDAKGNSCIKLGTSKAVGGFTINVPDNVNSIIIYAAKYKTNASKLSVDGTTYTLSNSSNDGVYDEITVDTSSNKAIAIVTVSGGARAMINAIAFVVPASDCDHSALSCGDTCSVCGEVIEHEYTNVCDANCNICNEAREVEGHTYDGDLDANCNKCGEERDVVMPTDPTEIVEAAYALAQNETFPKSVTLTGIISSVDTAYSEQYSNITVTIDVIDADGNLIEGKPIQCFRMKGEGANVIGEGDTITVSGIIKNYSGTVEFDTGCTLDSYEQTGCNHANAVYEYDCQPTTCPDCGNELAAVAEHSYVEDIINATCTKPGLATYECSVCGDSYDEELPLAAHNYVNDVCDVCGAAKPAGYAPITSADQLISGQYVMVVGTGYAPTYLDSSTSNPWVLTGQPVITDDVISADDAAAYLWTLTVDGNSVIITDANGVSIAPKGGNNNGIKEGEYAWSWTFEDGAFIFAGVDPDTVYLASNSTANSGDNKFRAYKTSTVTGTSAASYSYKFTLYAASSSAPKCEHEYFDACDPICLLCGEERETSHNIVHVAAVEPTCSALGNIEFWYCDACGAAWANEACTLVTNMMSVKLPMAEHTYDDEYDADCNVCGDVREVPEKPVEIIYGDVNGDGQVTITDEALVSQYLSGWEVTLNEAAADVNDDGQITITDEALISQYLSGWDVVLGPEKLFNDGVLGEW